MAVRSKRLAGPDDVTTGTLVVYTAAAGETALIKRYTLYNPGPLTTRVTLRMNGALDTHVVAVHVLAATSTVDVDTWWVLAPGDDLRIAHTITIQAVTYTIHGAELEGVAD